MRKPIKRIVSSLLGIALAVGTVQLPMTDVSAGDGNPIITPLGNGMNIIEVADEEHLVEALSESSAEVICLTQPITLSRSEDGKDNAFVIERQVTITGEALSLERAGIVLGADVVFENITLCFNTPVRNAIIANGYSLTINNVTSAGSYAIDLFCGGVTDYNGGNEIPQAGSDGIITMKGINTVGANIYAGSLSDIGYADENGNPYEDKPNTYAGDATIILEKDATGFDKIYAHGARENRSGGHANEWLESASLYTVSGNVDIKLNSNKNVVIDGATGTSQNATFIYQDAGNGYVCEPTLNNLDSIILLPSEAAITYLAPNTLQTSFDTLSVQENTRLSLVNMGAELSATSFEGGGEVVFADCSQKLDLSVAGGITQIAVGGIDFYGTGSTGTIDTEWTCINVTDGASECEFILMPNSNTPNMVLEKDDNGNWITVLGEISTAIRGITIEDIIDTENNYGIEVPIEVIYTTQDETNFLGDIPVKISVNGKETLWDEDVLGYITGTTASDVLMYFDFGEEGEILLVTNYDWDVYSVPKGRYEITLTIPADSMADKQEKVISFVLTVKCNEHSGGSATTTTQAICEVCNTPYGELLPRPETNIGMVSAENVYDTTDISSVILNRTDETIAGTLELTDEILQYGTHDYNWRFTPDDTDYYEVLTGTVAITVIDTKLPTVSYQINNDDEREFLNKDSYDLFFSDHQEIVINYSDEGSGIVTKQYYISNEVLEDVSHVEWQDYSEPVYLDKENTYFIYVKAADNYGNTVVMHSEGIVIYTEGVLDTEHIEHDYRRHEDLSVPFITNGNTITKLTYDNGDEISSDAYAVEENGMLTLKEEYTDTLKTGKYTYIVYMSPQGIENEDIVLNCRFVVKVKKHFMYVREDAPIRNNK